MLKIFVTLMLGTMPALAAKYSVNFSSGGPSSLPVCEKTSFFPTSTKAALRGGLAAVPKGLLVAREARFYVESRSEVGAPIKIESYQSFLNTKNKSRPRVVCGNSDLPLKNRFSMVAPTLIHHLDHSASTNIFWQFQVLAENTLLSSWNTRSLALNSQGDLEKTLNQLGYESKVYQISSSQYEIIYTQKLADKYQAVAVVYDLD